jgi:hypothetical protein
MFDQELSLTGFKVLAGEITETLSEGRVGSTGIGMGSCHCVVESGKDTRRSFFLDEIADDFIVKIVDWRPFNLFSRVFFLLRLERELNENLLSLERNWRFKPGAFH